MLSVFSRYGFELLDIVNWPDRVEDSIWQAEIIESLRVHGADQIHVDAISGDIGAVRFRPEEVAAGVLSETLTLGFLDAEKVAQEILKDLYP